MATDYPPLDDRTIVEDFVGASCSLQSINSRRLNWPPDIGYSPIPYHLANRNTLHIQNSASETVCSDRLSALPHWHVPSHTQDQQPLPWLVVYPYHPIIETWAQTTTQPFLTPSLNLYGIYGVVSSLVPAIAISYTIQIRKFA